MSNNARQADGETEHEVPDPLVKTAARQRDQCLHIVRKRPGLTAAEIAEHAKLDRYAASRRLPELRKAGIIKNAKKNGKVVKRRCGVVENDCILWYPVFEQQELF